MSPDKDVVFVIIFFLCFASGVSSLSDLSEGDPCVDNNRNGTCVKFNKCLSAAKYLAGAQTSSQICSFDGKIPLVCCTDCDTGNDIRNMIVASNGRFYRRTGDKTVDRCLEHLVRLPYRCRREGQLERIWNKRRKCYAYRHSKLPDYELSVFDYKRKQYPHMALLGYGADPNSTQWHCGGSIISEKFILTAAHCIASAEFGPVTYVALGILKRTDPIELWQIHRVKKVIPHPEYKSPIKYHDIALLETATPILFNAHVLPACLDTGYSSDNWVWEENRIYDTYAWATGWGALGPREQLADDLQTVLLRKNDQNICASHYPAHRHLPEGYNHTTQMCYGDKDENTCEGDSGGPLQRESNEARCMSVILGVTSYGRQCGFVGSSGIYTRVSHYVPWIESVVWPDEM